MSPSLRALLLALTLLPTLVAAQERVIVPLTEGWRFKLGDQPESVRTESFDDAQWERVRVPHNWNRMGGTAERRVDYQNYHGAGWYRLSFPTPEKLGERRVWLEFDAASTVADVWLNGVQLGGHAGAFARFRFDGTQHLKRQGTNLLLVKVDNSSQRDPASPTAEVPPMNGDWPMYGGLYRPVRLVLTAPVRIAMRDLGGPGIYARTESVEAEVAHIAVTTRLESDRTRATTIDVVTTILDADDRVVASSKQRQSVPAISSAEIKQTLQVPRPRLWDGVKDPYLHRVQVDLLDNRGTLLDRVQQPLGIRTFRIDANTGFWLNGRQLPLHGVSRHQDRPDKGWAIDTSDIDEDLRLIREIGANTVRFAHYQHAEAAYHATDRDGMMTWAEIPLVDRSAPWGKETTTPGFAANAQQQLRELIRQNYNHPSIMVWSIANEVNLEAAKGRGASNAKPLLERLQQIVHEEDPSRPATLADCCGSIPSEARAGLDTVAGITDVIGYNRYHGWYGNEVSFLGPDLDRLHALYPNQPISVSEYGAGGALTQHSDDPRGGPIAAFGRPHPEEFQSYILEESWRQIIARPYVWASWVWNMFDFSNEVRLEGDLTDTNDKGLVTFDRKTRKDAFYFYKANWSKEPFVYLTSRRYVERPYAQVEVKAYSNLPTVRLSLNGRDLGETQCELGICRWSNVTLDSGDNKLTAVSGTSSDAITWRFDGHPDRYAIRAGTLIGRRGADGTLWGSDAFVTGGTGHFRDTPSMSRGASPAPVRLVAKTEDQAPYESWRSGQFSYRIPVPNGRYRVTLHFFEPDAAIRPGDRKFDVVAEGKPAARGIDIVKEAGAAMTALSRELIVVVKDRALDLQFVAEKGEAVISGLQIEPGE